MIEILKKLGFEEMHNCVTFAWNRKMEGILNFTLYLKKLLAI